jgi:hypothetical protein
LIFMGVPKGTPRPLNAGRKKGTPNKRTAARAVLRRIDAEGIAGAGFGPGDAYRALWEQVGILREELAAEERRRSSDQSRRDTLRDQLVRVLHKLLPFERPRLTAITVKSDADNPPRVRADLSRLIDAELDTLERLCLKAGAGHTGEARPDVTLRRPSEPPRVATRR